MTKIFRRYGEIWTHDESSFFGKTSPTMHRFSEDPMSRRLEDINKHIREYDVVPGSYVILDDADLFYQRDRRPLDWKMNLDECFIHTDEEIGLTEEQTDRAIEILNS